MTHASLPASGKQAIFKTMSCTALVFASPAVLGNASSEPSELYLLRVNRRSARQHPRAGPANSIRLNGEQMASQETQNATKYVHISFACVCASFAHSNFWCPYQERLLLGQDPSRGLLGVGSACRIDRRGL
jgi:hypothetical protein